MAYDELLAERVRDALAGHPLSQSEKKMFGGYGFFINGNMALGIMEDNLMVKLGDEGTMQALTDYPNTRPAQFKDMTMAGWVFVDQTDLDEEQLQFWVDEAVDFVSTLPEKLPKKKK